MSTRVEQFCGRLRDRLNAIEGRAETIKAYVVGRSEAVEKTLRGMLEEACTKLQAQKDQVERIRTNLKAMAPQKIAETKEAVSEWKAKRETRKLQARADRLTAYAADTMDYAVGAIDAAEEAILDAMVARIDADAAQ
jgi:hypothetical protein